MGLLRSLLITLSSALILFSCTNSNKSQNEGHEIQTIEKDGVIEIDGFKLNYIRRGTGKPIIVIGSSEYYSKAFSKELEENFELIFVDSRHFVADCNPTEEELDNINLSTFSSDLESIRKHLDLEKIGLIGHSIHGQIALDYAVKYPDNLTKLIIIGGVPYSGEEIEDYKEELWNTEANEERKTILSTNAELLKNAIDSITSDQIFAVSYHYNAPLYWANPNYDASSLLDELRTCPQVFGKLGGSIPSKKEVIEKLKSISAPTLLILGKLDFAIPYKAWEEMLNANSKIKYILMENASHNPHTEESTQAAFDKHLTQWISTLN